MGLGIAEGAVSGCVRKRRRAAECTPYPPSTDPTPNAASGSFATVGR